MDSGMNEVSAGSEMPQVRATLDAWRARGADRVNPMRFRFIDAFARRAAGREGDIRRVLDERLAALITDYSGEVERAEAEIADAKFDVPVDADTASRMPTQNVPPPGALAELVDLLTNRATATHESEASVRRDALDPHSHHRDRSPDLPVLDYFREMWSRFSTEKTLRQSLEQVPDNAGPLNSNSLIHRSLSLMRELSPGYLQQFLSYVEALSWMEQLAVPEAARTSSAKKGARGKGTTR